PHFFIILFFLSGRRQPISTLFPYTTLFRSGRRLQRCLSEGGAPASRGQARRGRSHSGSDRRQEGRLPLRHDGYRHHRGPDQTHRSEEHTSELQSLAYLVCRLLLEKKKKRRK